MDILPPAPHSTLRDILPIMSETDSISACSHPLHPRARDGILLFNQGEYFEAHEALEDAWRVEPEPIRDLYRGILQIAVTYLHILRRNYSGAIKVYGRSQKWLRGWPDSCQGVDVRQLQVDVRTVMQALEGLGAERIADFNRSLFKPISLKPVTGKRVYTCDRCGYEIIERNCKVTCPNCGNRFDCSDLNIYFD